MQGYSGIRQPAGFSRICILLAVIAGGLVWLFKRMKLM
jgi:hypothetical protein